MLQNDYLKNFFGDDDVAQIETRKYIPMKDTLENYETVLQQAFVFNDSSPMKDNYVAVLQQNDNGTIQVAIKPKTNDAVKKFNNEYSTLRLNKRLQDIFGSIGVTVGQLYKYEYEGGRLGVTDFSKAAGMAQDFSSLIRVANKTAGAKSISEEFSHLIIGVLNGETMIQRSLKYLSQNEQVMQFILGDEYEDTVKFHNGNMALVAEETLGRILQDNLIRYYDNNGDSLIDRTLNFIRGKFRDFDYTDVERVLVEANSEMGRLAKNILEKTIEISENDVKSARRDVEFNSLDERAKRNLKILQNSIDTEVKRFSIT